MTDVPSLQFAQAMLSAQPFSVLVGARLTALGAGEAKPELDVRDELRQQDGFLHGGVLSYAVDNAITFAAGAAAAVRGCRPPASPSAICGPRAAPY